MLVPLDRVVRSLTLRPGAVVWALVMAASMLFARPAAAIEQSVVQRSIVDERFDLDGGGVESFLVEALPTEGGESASSAISSSVSTTPGSWSPEMTRIALTCLTGGSSDWSDASPTYDPDGDLAPYSDERGATMMAPTRVRPVADDTLDAAPRPCGAELFGQALDRDRHSPQKSPPPAHLEPADLSRALPAPVSCLLEIAPEIAPHQRAADGVTRTIERPPTVS